jgi:DNA-binding transcriptional LysR family regulator
VELRLLRYFVAVVDDGSISRAAIRLNVAQSAVSRAMRALEHTFGVSLLIRSSRSTKPTNAGRVLADEARLVLERVDAMSEHVRAASQLGQRIRCAAATGDVPLAVKVTSTFRGHQGAAEEVDITSAEVVASDPGTLLDALRFGNCDVALVRGPFDARGVDSELVRTEPRVVLLRRDHPLAGLERVHISQLHDEPITVWPAMSGAEREHWAGADLDRHVWRAGPTNTNAIDVQLAVQLGRAVAFIPESLLPDGADPHGISARPVDGLSPSTLSLVWLTDSTSLPLARFVRHVLAQTAAFRSEIRPMSG